MALNLSEAETGYKLKKKLVQPTEFTKVFDDWQLSVRSFFLSRVSLEEGEVPVFAHFKPITGLLPAVRNILGVGRQAQS